MIPEPDKTFLEIVNSKNRSQLREYWKENYSKLTWKQFKYLIYIEKTKVVIKGKPLI